MQPVCEQLVCSVRIVLCIAYVKILRSVPHAFDARTWFETGPKLPLCFLEISYVDLLDLVGAAK